jgi:hypothetical protein
MASQGVASVVVTADNIENNSPPLKIMKSTQKEAD